MALTIINHHNISYHNHQNWSFLSSKDPRGSSPYNAASKSWKKSWATSEANSEHTALDVKSCGAKRSWDWKTSEKTCTKIWTPEKHSFFLMEKCGRTMEHHRNLGKSVENVGNPLTAWRELWKEMTKTSINGDDNGKMMMVKRGLHRQKHRQKRRGPRYRMNESKATAGPGDVN